MKKIVCVIPARLLSTRFPKKILASLNGKPLIERVYQAAKNCPYFDEVVIALDSVETEKVVKSFGGTYFMTDKSHKSGTDRLIELVLSDKIQGDIFVNWQGDEPFIKSSMIKSLLSSIEKDEEEIWTLCKKIPYNADPHQTKVVKNKLGKALYFSRSPIPYSFEYTESNKRNAHIISAKRSNHLEDEDNFSEKMRNPTIFKHIGIYAYRRSAIEKIAKMGSSSLEEAEKLEQLRFLDYGLSITVHETEHETLGIDLLEHLKEAEKLLV